MNYPLISEYVEAIKSAEDNFKELTNLRPVLGEDGEPVMTGGNFAEVFKMKDEKTGKLYAVKCFLREQEGRAEAYRQIAEELEYVSSTFLTPIKYLDKELFVDTSNSEESEFPVLLMDWVEGQTLDKYIREHIDDQYELSLLAYQFSRLAMWLLPQPFAHGDLKPDNILVKNDGTLVLVDYDGMYVPAMKGQKSRELGSPDFRHPSRTENDFDEHIDDFSLVSILLSLKAIAIQPELLEQYGASDRLLFSEKDYRNLSESRVLEALRPLMQDAEFASLYSLFILASSQNNLSLVSFRLFNLSRPDRSQFEEVNLSTEVTEEDMANAWTDEYGVMYSADKKRLLLVPDNITEYKIRKGTIVICDEAFGKSNLGGKRKHNINSLYIPETVRIIGSDALYGFQHLCEIVVIEKNPIYDSRDNCNAIIRTETNELLFGCQTTVIPNDVSTISINAFLSCTNLKSISIPNSVTSIGEQAFMNCGNLKTIYIPESVVEIGERAFNGSGIESVVVDKKNHIYDSRDNCNAIISKKDNILIFGCKNSIIPTTVTVIGRSAFECCEIKVLIVPNSVSAIETHAFLACSDLKTIIFPYGLIRIESDAFSCCNKLTNITFNNLIENVGFNAFYFCEAIERINIPNGTRNKFEEFLPEYKDKLVEQDEDDDLSTEVSEDDLANAWTDEYGVIYSADRKRLLKAPKDIEEYSIKEGTKVICNGFSSKYDWGRNVTGAFKDCTSLRSLSIPDSVTKIGNVAFEGCSSLTNLYIPNSVNQIGAGAFCNCRNLNVVNLPYDLNEIAENTFEGCVSLMTIQIPYNVNKIGSRAFHCCEKLSSIIIPNEVIEIEEEAFAGCIKMSSVTLSFNTKTIGYGIFNSCDSLETINLTSTHNILGVYVREEFGKLIPDHADKIWEIQDTEMYATSISDFDKRNNVKDEFDVVYSVDGKRLLYAPDNLTDYTIKDGTKFICEYAFSKCENLTSLIIPESVIEIGGHAFEDCLALSLITLPNSVIKLGVSAFCRCKSLSTIRLSNRMKDITGHVFQYCSNLRSITFPEGLITIDTCAFEWCKGLASIHISSSIKNINSGAFAGCSNLKSIIVDKGNVKYDSRNNCDAIIDGKTLVVGCLNTKIPEGISVIGDSAFAGCLNLQHIDIPMSVNEIGAFAFNACIGLKSINIPEGVTAIGTSAFNGCHGLESITIPQSVEEIGWHALWDCISLRSIYIPKGTKKKYEILVPDFERNGKMIEQ